MRLDDLLRVMRDEFAQSADHVDQRLMAWLGAGPAAADTEAGAMAAELDRVASTARLISLEGLALALEQLRDATLALAMVDEDTMGEGLGWLSSWRVAFEDSFGAPGAGVQADALLAYLAAGPMAPDSDTLAALRELLVLPPALAAEVTDLATPITVATDADVSLAVPDDVDHDLLEAFLADAPAQVALLSDAVRTLVRHGLSAEAIQEAQRVAHTFKGSGSIIGITGVARLAHRIEDLIEFAAEQGGRLPAAMGRDLEQASATLDQMIYALRGEEEPPTEARAHLQRLLDWAQAIADGSWADGPRDTAVDEATATRADVELPSPQPSAAVAAAPDSNQTHLRVATASLDRLLRRAGQGLVHGGRLDEQLRSVQQQLHAMQLLNRELGGRLSELHMALDRQGVQLQEKVQAAGQNFDPLEMDRYNHVQTLSRFVAELVSDEAELTQQAHKSAQSAALTLHAQQQGLTEQHRELLAARLVPFRQIVSRLRRTVSQTGALLQRPVRLEVVGETTQLDSDVLERLTEPLLHLLRNAVDHGIEPAEERALYGKEAEGVVRLEVQRDGQTVQLRCSDDGRGIDLAAVHAKALDLGLLSAEEEPSAAVVARLILLPGFSTRHAVTEVSGRGVGMDVVAERVRAMKGHVDIASEPLAGTTITLRLPASSGALHALVVAVAGERFALPTEAVRMALAAGQGSLVDGHFHLGHERHRCLPLADALGLPDSGKPADERPVVLVRGPEGTLALLVDEVVDARELILQELGGLLRGARGVAGGALRSDGRVLFVLDVDRLGGSTAPALAQASAAALRQRAQQRRQRVLVVDDAISVRKAVSQLLEDAGFEVLTARDGFEALRQLESDSVDIVLTDLEMPQLNGLDLTRRLRQIDNTAGVPIVMITSRGTDKHRQAAQDAGVNHYLTKPYTDRDLLAVVRDLLRESAATAGAIAAS